MVRDDRPHSSAAGRALWLCAPVVVGAALARAIGVPWGIGWGNALSFVALGSSLTLLLAGVVTLVRSKTPPGWRVWLLWVTSLALVLVDLVWDPTVQIRPSSPSLVVLPIGLAAAGALTPRALWMRGLRVAALAAAVFWTGAFFLLFVCAWHASVRFGVGYLSTAIRFRTP